MESLEADLEASKLKLNANYPNIEKLCHHIGYNLDKKAREVALRSSASTRNLASVSYQIAAMDFEQFHRECEEEYMATEYTDKHATERKNEHFKRNPYKEVKSEMSAMRHEFFFELSAMRQNVEIFFKKLKCKRWGA